MEDFLVEHQGRRINFCCRECLELFEQDPAPYLKNLPKTSPQKSSDAGAIRTFIKGTGLRYVAAVANEWPEWFAACGLMVAALIAFKLARQYGSHRIQQLSRSRPLLILALILPLSSAVIWRAVLIHERNLQLADQLMLAHYKDKIHAATFTDFGEPPKPVRPDWPKRITGTYYRGNDERSPMLQNGGRYRTCTFHVSLVTGTGEAVQYGDSIQGKGLSLRLEVVRAPFLPDFFFSERLLNQFYLTSSNDPFAGHTEPLKDRVYLKEIEKSSRWEMVYPLLAPSETLPPKLDGIVYLRQNYVLDKQVLGARFWYAMQFQLRFENNKITGDSDIWMGSLWCSQPHWKLPRHEWFSENPIPELTSPNTTNDSKLLGIDDYK